MSPATSFSALAKTTAEPSAFDEKSSAAKAPLKPFGPCETSSSAPAAVRL